METRAAIIRNYLFRLLLTGVFVSAGVGKLLDLPAFAAQLQKFGLSDPTLAATAGRFLPSLEIVCGAALLYRPLATGATALCLALLLLFEAALGRGWLLGLDADCGCFGHLLGGLGIRGAFVRNLGLLAVAAFLLAHQWKSISRPQP